MSRPPKPAPGKPPEPGRPDRLARDVALNRRAGAVAAAALLLGLAAVGALALRAPVDEPARAAAEAAQTRAEAAFERAEAALSAAEAARATAAEALAGAEEARGAAAGAAEEAATARSGSEAAGGRLDALDAAGEDTRAALAALASELAGLRSGGEARAAEAQATLDRLQASLDDQRTSAEAEAAELRAAVEELARSRDRGPAALPTSVASGAFPIGERGLEPRELSDGRAYVIGFERFPDRFDAAAFSDADPAVVVSVSAEVEEAGELAVGSFSATVLYADSAGFAWFASAPGPEALAAARLTYVAVAQ